MPEVIDLLHQNRELIDQLPFAVYCTQIQSGKFRFANKALASLSGYTVEELEDGKRDASDLYADQTVRVKWKSALKNHDGPLVSQFQFNPRGRPTAQRRPHVVEIAQKFGELAIGSLVDFTDELHKRSTDLRTLENKVETYRAVLNLDWVNAAVHEIDHLGRITWMNLRERRLLQIEDQEYEEWIKAQPHVCKLSSPAMHEAIEARVRQKLGGLLELINGEDRKFRTRPHREPFDSSSLLVPVNLRDFGIVRPDAPAEYSGIVTTVRDERIPSDVTSILCEFGPRNPVLESLHIHTFIKVKRQYAYLFNEKISRPAGANQDYLDELVFTFGNETFCQEVMALSRAHKTGVPIQNKRDIEGKTENELFPTYAPQFAHADEQVINASPSTPPHDDQRIEKHPSMEGDSSIDVQVYKIPIRHPQDPSVYVGVQGFYWKLEDIKTHDRLSEIREHLKRHYSPAEILNNIPRPVYRKDSKCQFIYCNSAYIKDINELPPDERNASFPHPCTIHDIIGRSDFDIFPSKRAEKYDDADKDILTREVEQFEQVERHGRGRVRVIKTPIWEGTPSNGGKIVGIQGIFWFLEPDEAELYEPVRIDWKRGLLCLPDKPALSINVHSKEMPWYLFDYLWSRRGKPVTYAEIAANVLGDLKVAGELDHENPETRRAARNAVQSKKRTLLESMAKLGIASDDGTDMSKTFWFTDVADGYQLDSGIKFD